jgi:Bacterial extracellular solute-binding proteins, family 3
MINDFGSTLTIIKKPDKRTVMGVAFLKKNVEPIHVLLLLITLLLSLNSQAAKTIRMYDTDHGIPAYAKGLLRLVLSKVPEKKYVFDESTFNNTEERNIQMLEDGTLDVLWYTATKENEERMRPIRVCLFKGLLGYRVLMIAKGNQYRFDNIKNIEDLRKISLGQGRFWADTVILKENHLKVVEVTKHVSLFFMLEGDRYDGFPRGIHEPWEEIKRWSNFEFEVEKNLLLVYHNPYYFFVNKNNSELAQDIEKGFDIAIEDGSFDQYLLNDPAIKEALLKVNLKNRIIIPLENPSLSPLTPLNDKRLWFDPYNY